MTSSSALVRGITTLLIIVAGVLAILDLAGGPTPLGAWQAAICGFALAGWWIVFNGRARLGDRQERLLFWIGTGCSLFLGVAGAIDVI
jgi:hypothetical protein